MLLYKKKKKKSKRAEQATKLLYDKSFCKSTIQKITEIMNFCPFSCANLMKTIMNNFISCCATFRFSATLHR